MNLKLKEKFLTDEKGRKEAVVLDVGTYEELLEDLEDLAAIADRKNEPAIPWAEVERKLKKKWPSLR
jgi:low affinity Fe/Cu permease